MIVIASTFIAEPMQGSLDFLLQKFTTDSCQFYYNQLYQQLMLTHSALRNNTEGVNVLLIRFADLLPKGRKDALSKFKLNVTELWQAILIAKDACKLPFLVFITPSTGSAAEARAFANAEKELHQALAEQQRLWLVTPQDIHSLYPIAEVMNHFTDKSAHVPYTLEFYIALSHMIVRKYYVLHTKPYKVIVVDCDGTLWNGIIEEDGIDGIHLTAREQYLQNFLVNQHDHGMLLCLCSKNSAASVLNVFHHKKNMLLNLTKHISSYRINWKNKSENLHSLAQELNLPLDSFIFIDDNPLECAQVREKCKEVLIIELPADDEKMRALLSHIWAFDHLQVNDTDKQRTFFYQQNSLRQRLHNTSLSYAEFIHQLNLQLTLRQANAGDLSRILELGQRTHQFNVNPKMITEADILSRIAQQEGCLVILAEDRFGDYGLIAIAIYDVNETRLQIKTLLVSCRALDKGIEYSLVNELMSIAEKKQLSHLEVMFVPSDKNEPALNFLKVIAKLRRLPASGRLLLPVSLKQEIIYLPEKSKIKNINKRTQKNELIAEYRNDFLLEIAKDYQSNPGLIPQHDTNNASLDVMRHRVLQILQQHHVNIDHLDSALLACGVSSLRAVLISADIYRHFNVEISYVELINSRMTIRKLLKQVLIDSAKVTRTPVVGEQDLSKSQFLPLSLAQQKLWLAEQTEPNTANNNMFIALEILGNLDRGILQKSFSSLLARHDALRFSFFSENGEAYIKIQNEVETDFTVDYEVCATDLEAKEKIEQKSGLPFNLNHAPLLRVVLLHVSGNKTILLICIHHIIHDGWSLNILLQELSSLYNAYVRGLPNPLPSLSSSYERFIKWQQQHINSEILAQQRQFWQQHYQELPTLNLNYDYLQHDGEAKSKRISFKLSKSLSLQLKQLANATQTTLYDILLAGFSLLLAHFTNDSDIPVLSAASGRHYPQTQNLLGFFINLLVLRIKINKEDSFLQLLKNTKEFLMTAFANQDLPLNQLIQIISPGSSSKFFSRIPAGFIFQNYQLNSVIFNGMIAKRVCSDPAEILYDSCQTCRFGNLVCFVQEYQYVIHGLFEYNSTLFKPSTIRGMIAAFKILLKNIVKNSRQTALDIALVSSATRNKLLYKFNEALTLLQDRHCFSLAHARLRNDEGGNARLRNDEGGNARLRNKLTLTMMFSEIVATYPHKIAIKHDGNEISYLALDQLTNRLVNCLQERGVTHETAVGIYLPQGIDWIVAMLAIIKAGGCYVPVDLDYPSERISYLLEDANIKIMIIAAESNLPQVLTNHSTVFLCINREELAIYPSTIANAVQQSAKQLAYIMYTSGSTGQPKGVLIIQQGIIRLIKSTNYISLQSDDIMGQTSSLGFDVATFEIWGALLHGATLVIVDKRILLNTKDLADFLQQENLSILFLTAQLFHIHAFNQPAMFGGLKYLIMSGDTLSAEAVRSVINTETRPIYIINAYGPTENTTFSTAYTINQDKALPDSLPIGKPITGTEVYILDDRLHVKAINAPGRLFVGGLGVAQGYVNHKDLTAAKFVANPYCADDILYDTGDITAWLPDGNIKFFGRVDSQVKVNGYRIELSEIELHLSKHPAIEQAVVLLQTQNSQHKRLVAYVRLQSTANLAEINLQEYLKTYLPKYMIPHVYYDLDVFPMTQNGKVDKCALAAKSSVPFSYKSYELPNNSLQESLILIFAEILDYPQGSIGINDDFFDIGGNSLSAIRLINEIYLKFFVKVDIATLYASSTIRLLATKIAELLNANVKSPVFSHDRLSFYISQTLHKIKEGDPAKSPIIFIHPIGGTGFCYLALIKCLPHDQACYTIRDPSIDADRVLFASIADMANYYNQIILQHFAEKTTVILAGFSFGGMLCLEMLCQLEANNQGDQVKFLIAFDTWILADVADVAIVEAVKSRMLHQYDQVMCTLMLQDIEPKPWMELNFSRLQRLSFNYNPGIVNKDILLFKAQDISTEFMVIQHPTNNLSLHTRKTVKVCMVPGSHDTILQRPYVNKLAESLTAFLNSRQELEYELPRNI